jgi:hypothetical protein
MRPLPQNMPLPGINRHLNLPLHSVTSTGPSKCHRLTRRQPPILLPMHNQHPRQALWHPFPLQPTNRTRILRNPIIPLPIPGWATNTLPLHIRFITRHNQHVQICTPGTAYRAFDLPVPKLGFDVSTCGEEIGEDSAL